MSGLNTAAILTALQSHVQQVGSFAVVDIGEPKQPPSGDGFTAAIWPDRIVPHPGGSGLSATAAVVVYLIRIYMNMLQEPQDAIDPAVIAVTDKIISDLSGDFTLGTQIRNVDLLGETTAALSAQAGYVSIGQTLFRVMDITVPVIINDAWAQTA